MLLECRRPSPRPGIALKEGLACAKDCLKVLDETTVEDWNARVTVPATGLADVNRPWAEVRSTVGLIGSKCQLSIRKGYGTYTYPSTAADRDNARKPSAPTSEKDQQGLDSPLQKKGAQNDYSF